MWLRFFVSSILLGHIIAVVASQPSTGSRDSGQEYEKCTPTDCRGKSGCLTLFQHPNYRGWYQCLTFNGDECVTLNKWWIGATGGSGRVSSVNTHGTCIRLYDGVGCTGRNIDVYAGSPYHNDLSQLYFGDMMNSASSCERVPPPFSIGVNFNKCSSSECVGKKTCATIYEQRNHGGWYTCVTIRDTECVTLGDWWQLENVSRTSSVDTHNTCVRLYDGKDCTKAFIELRPGSTHSIDFRKSRPNAGARSVGACDRETVRTGTNILAPFIGKKNCTSADCSRKAGCATIYSNQGYVEYHQCLKLDNEECVTLFDWMRTSGSGTNLPNVGLTAVDSHGTCVRLYNGMACNGAYLEGNNFNSSIYKFNGMFYNGNIKSISSCVRPISYNPKCYVQTLFSRNVKSDEVSEATSHFLDALDGISEVTVSALSMAIPVIDPFTAFLKFLVGLFESSKDDEALIDAKIEKAFARNSASEIGAKIHTINNRVKSLLSPYTNQAERMTDLKIVLNTCEEIKKLLDDDKYSFSHNKVASSPYFVSFASLYLSVAKFSYEMRNHTEARNDIIDEMKGLTTLAERFLIEGKQQRKDKFPDKNKSGYRIIEDKLVCDDVVGSRYPADCGAYMKCGTEMNACAACLENIHSSIDLEFERFFRPVINELKRFTGMSVVNATQNLNVVFALSER